MLLQLPDPPPLTQTGIDIWGPVGSAMNNLWTENRRGQVDNSETKVIKWRSQQLHELFFLSGRRGILFRSPEPGEVPTFIGTLIQFFKVVTFGKKKKGAQRAIKETGY